MRDTFHHYEDRRGPRRVFVDGAEVQHVRWADTEKGVVEFIPDAKDALQCYRAFFALKLHARQIRGTVTVEFID